MTLPTIRTGVLYDGVGERSRHWAEFTPPSYASPVRFYADTEDEAIEQAWEYLDLVDMAQRAPVNDPVDHPAHYTSFGAEVIEITEHLNFCRGNAVKYLARAGLKNPATELEDLEKALWYIEREISRLRRA